VVISVVVVAGGAAVVVLVVVVVVAVLITIFVGLVVFFLSFSFTSLFPYFLNQFCDRRTGVVFRSLACHPFPTLQPEQCILSQIRVVAVTFSCDTDLCPV
jgi:hypothetical protein